jgi:hypothetical protein
MYAAAGGASCRNARRKQEQQQKLADKEAAAKALREKLEAARAARLEKLTRSRPFHQLPESYLRTHQIQGRKLSVGYTGHSSKLLLPHSNEQSTKHRSPSHQNLHHSRHYTHQTNNSNSNSHNYNNDLLRTPTHRNRSSSIMRLGRLGVEHKLTKSATASFPLALLHADSQNQHQNSNNQHQNNHNLLHVTKPVDFQIPFDHDGIFITPATPIPSPSPKHHEGEALKTREEYEKEDDFLNFPLERACSVYRSKKLAENDPNIQFYHEDDDDNHQAHLQTQQQQQQQQQCEYFPGAMPNGSHHAHWADEMYDEDDFRICDHIEVICCHSTSSFISC